MNETSPSPKIDNKKTNILLGIIVLLMMIIIAGGAYMLASGNKISNDEEKQKLKQEQISEETEDNSDIKQDKSEDTKEDETDDKKINEEEPKDDEEIDTEKTDKTPESDEEKDTETNKEESKTEENSDKKEPEDSDTGQKDPDVEEITLKDVSGGKNEGTASRKYKNNEFSLKVEAKLTEPEKDFQYEAWLIKTNRGGAIPLFLLNIGKLEKDENGIYKLNFNTNNDYTRYREIAVTLEPKDNDPDPSTRILEGNFK